MALFRRLPEERIAVSLAIGQLVYALNSEIRCNGLFYSVLLSRVLAYEVERLCSTQGALGRASCCLVISHCSRFFELSSDVHPACTTSV
jgi:hypothetical protein